MSVDPLPTITSTSSVFIIGDFNTYGEPYIKERSIIRLNQDGSKDETFDNLDAFAVGTSISKVRLLPDNNYAVYSGSAVSYKGSVASNLHIIDNSGNRVNTHNAYNATYSVGTSILSVFGATNLVYDQSVGGTHSGKIYAYGISGTMGGLTFSGLLRLNPDWTIDTSFNTYISSTQSGFSTGTVAVVKILSDGNLIVGGKITTFKGSGSYMNGNGICKLDTNGNILPWTISAPITSSTTECVLDILETSNGDLFVGGAWTHYNGLTTASNLKIMKLQSNGTKITSFTNQSGSNTVTFKQFHLRSDGNLLALCGGTLILSNSFSGGLIVLDPTTGALVTSFQKGYGVGSSNNAIKFVISNNSIILPNGAGGYSWDKSFTGGLVKLDLTTASLDRNFKKSVSNIGLISDIIVDQNGKIVVVGSFKYWKRPNMHAVKIGPNGSLDPTFDTGIVNPPLTGLTHTNNASFKDNLGNIYLYNISLQGYDDSVFYLNGVSGAPNLPNVNYPNGIVKISATGSHKTEYLPVMNALWPTGGNGGYVLNACTDNNGFVYAVGQFTRNTQNTSGELISHIAKLSATTGLVDSTFRINSGNGFRAGTQESSGVTYTITYDQTINKLYVGGAFTSYNNTGQTASRIARINTDGTFDSSFNTYISSTQSGYNSTVTLISLDRTGGPNDGKIYVYGSGITTYKGVTVSSITRLNPDGSLDTTFLTASPNNTVYSILPLQSGGLFIGGSISLYNSNSVNKIVKLNSDGTIDSSFNTGTGFEYIPLNDTNLTYTLQGSSVVRVIKYDPADKIYVGGYFGKYNDVPKNCIVRLNMDGSIDTTFNDGGYGLQANTTATIGGVFDITVI
jgi:uncharacterized delta-60 repeat protein